jgi:hypothetical protein
LKFGHPLPQHRHPRLDEALPLFRRLILRVLSQIPMLACALDLLRQLLGQLAFEQSDFILEALDQLGFHVAKNSNMLSSPAPL